MAEVKERYRALLEIMEALKRAYEYYEVAECGTCLEGELQRAKTKILNLFS